MKTLKGKPTFHILLILLVLATSCVPDSLTKFKEDTAAGDTVETDDGSSTDDSTEDTGTGVVDESGNEVDPATIESPTIFRYDTIQPYVFVTGDADLITKEDSANIVEQIFIEGIMGDYLINQLVGADGSTVEGAELSSASRTNFLDPLATSGFNFGTDLTVTYASTFELDNETGTIGVQSSTVEPLRPFTVAPFTFDFYSPADDANASINVTLTPTITIQAPIPEELTMETDTSFNCTGADIPTTVPSPASIGDTYRIATTCFYNYDGTNTNTVAYPYSGSIYIGFKLDTNAGFLLNSSTESFTTDRGATGTITYKDSNGNIYGTLTSGRVYPGDVIDNAFPFSNAEATITNLKYFFQPDSNINLKLVNNTAVAPESHISYDNSTKISITPDLPSSLRLVKDVDSPLFGYIIDISGASDHTYQAAKEYTVTVENDLTERTFKFELGIVNPPSNLSYSQMAAFRVKNLIQATSDFVVGQKVSSAPLPPLSSGATGIIKRILDIDGNEKYLIVQVIDGEFVKDSSLDNYKSFIDEEAVILDDPKSLTHVMQINSTADFNPTYIAESPSLCMNFGGSPTEYARAVVTANPTEGSLSKYLFLNQIRDTSDPNSERNFVSTNTTVSDCNTANSYTVEEIWAPVMSATFSSTASLVSGMDLLTNNALPGEQRANLVVSEIAGSTALLQSSNGAPITLAAGEQFSIVRPYSASGATINSFETLVTFELQRGVDSSIIATLPLGESITYTISPDLPPGLSLDESTGFISGSPEVAAASKEYIVTATNILGTASTAFNLIIEDYFEVEIDIASTPKFYSHKDGESNFFNKCRIKKRDIASNPKSTTAEVEDVVDIDCFVDVGENDLYGSDINFNVKAGPGICHSVEYKPYSFFKRRPNKTTGSNSGIDYDASARYIVQVVTGASSDCVAATDTSGITDDLGNVTGVLGYTGDGMYINSTLFEGGLDDLCTGKYNDINCDNGSFAYATISYAYTPEEVDPDTGTVTTPSSCETSVETFTHNCEGDPRACLDGPLVSQVGRAAVDGGMVGVITNSFSGLDTTYTPDRPIDKSGASNVFIANYTNSISCEDPTRVDYYSDGVKAHAARANMFFSPQNIVDPLIGANPFYTFNCLDQANDLQARINIHVRDWDSKFDLANIDKTSQATDWGMDNDSLDVFGESFNKYSDWDDLNEGSQYSACGPSTAPTMANTYTAFPITASGDANSLSVDIAGGAPYDYVYPGMDIQIAGVNYQVKDVGVDQISLTLPLETTVSGAAIQGIQRIRFPAYLYDY